MIIELTAAALLSAARVTAPVLPVEFSPPIREVVIYQPVGVLNQLSGLTLPPGTREAYENEFLTGQVYFGAFAITKEFGYGYVTGANSLDAAREIALEECYKQAPRCLIYAEILPAGYEGLLPGQVSLSAEAGNYHSNPDPSWGSYRAMAISEDGAYSVVWNYGSPAEAAQAALDDCATFAITDLPNLRDMPCMLIPFK